MYRLVIKHPEHSATEWTFEGFISTGFLRILYYTWSTYSVGVDTRPDCVRRWSHVVAPRHQVLIGIHQVVQVLLIQEALEELTVIGAWELHPIIPLRKCTASEGGSAHLVFFFPRHKPGSQGTAGGPGPFCRTPLLVL